MSAQPGLFLTTAAERYACLERNSATGLDRKARGQKRALDAEHKRWKEDTLFLFQSFLAGIEVGETFAMEDFRAYAASNGHREPHSHKVWGSMPAFYRSRGMPILRTDRMRIANSPLTHGHPVTLWKKTAATHEA